MANKQHYSGIGGQAVLEGVMMRRENMVAVAVRKKSRDIEVEVEEHHAPLEGTIWQRLPFVRGILVFADSLAIGIKTLNFSTRMYDEEETPPKDMRAAEQEEKKENVLLCLTTAISFAFALFLFVFLPVLLTDIIRGAIRSDWFLALVEGLIRIAIFLVYLIAISSMKDIHRLYQYHGAEHKCINCIERGKPLTKRYVLQSSRFHKRCGTSFLFLVMLVSVVLFVFIRVDSTALRLLTRIVLIPVVAGISYEILRAAGRRDTPLIRVLSAPGLWLQRFTTREPDGDMVEVAIASVEAVFDWKSYLIREFGYTERDFDGL
ncbi:MAG: DUF1385 domain-containing protein [Lachnospiraceae bacterium]|jgi:uncharacterized protein YqhQ|nr:DUF1385 domain-containing protein [Lachnospiraceae bacterium]MCI1398338.1 DUF1385 domain-containing protein [Lachnospiraceae bacterium]MCI1424494.1 DUF1385 domain-containing protein [Lachnospiraceae bacterium]MCI1453284.1 DUF1385 domain-containing protein [Lachnospiraceae bacterium]MDD5847960.1 DUF1385 domain-containing protein [Bacillota bacterium]